MFWLTIRMEVSSISQSVVKNHLAMLLMSWSGLYLRTYENTSQARSTSCRFEGSYSASLERRMKKNHATRSFGTLSIRLKNCWNPLHASLKRTVRENSVSCKKPSLERKLNVLESNWEENSWKVQVGSWCAGRKDWQRAMGSAQTSLSQEIISSFEGSFVSSFSTQ